MAELLVYELELVPGCRCYLLATNTTIVYFASMEDASVGL